MLALSTSWNTASNKSGLQIVKEIQRLGFGSVELAFFHTKRHLEQILKYKGIRVVSLHNYCPIPDGFRFRQALPDCYSLSSTNNSERKKAIHFTKRTISTAAKFKAKVVVLHCGRVEVRDYTRKLFDIKDSKPESCKLNSLKDLVLEERERNKHRFLDSILLSLRELSDFSYNLGVAIGIENRNYVLEIPNFSEIEVFLSNFSKKGVGYWHDTGHAYLLEKIGLQKHLDYLKKYSKNLLGVHFHDVEKFKDHKAPFSNGGEINIDLFKPFIKKNTIKVIEAHKPATAKEIIFARKKIEKLFNR